MDWIFNTWLYGLRIQYTMTASPASDWLNDQLSYQQICITINGLSDIVYVLVNKVRVVLGQLLMLKDDGDLTSVPAII